MLLSMQSKPVILKKYQKIEIICPLAVEIFTFRGIDAIKSRLRLNT